MNSGQPCPCEGDRTPIHAAWGYVTREHHPGAVLCLFLLIYNRVRDKNVFSGKDKEELAEKTHFHNKNSFFKAMLSDRVWNWDFLLHRPPRPPPASLQGEAPGPGTRHTAGAAWDTLSAGFCGNSDSRLLKLRITLKMDKLKASKTSNTVVKSVGVALEAPACVMWGGSFDDDGTGDPSSSHTAETPSSSRSRHLPSHWPHRGRRRRRRRTRPRPGGCGPRTPSRRPCRQGTHAGC